jgi:hypothetical protein
MSKKRTINVGYTGASSLENQVKKILVLAANPIDTTWLRLDEELRDIKKSLERSEYRDRFVLEKELAVSHRDFRQALLSHKPHIVHFTGHGTKNGIMLDGDLGSSQLMTAEALSQLFEFFKDTLECVILNACYSESQASAINQHIGYVIGMNGPIGDRSGIEFAVGFYDTLGAGGSYEEAFKIGRIAILQYFPGIKEDEIPVLHINERLKPRVKPPQSEIEVVQVKFHIQSTGEVFDFKLRLNARTSVEKDRLIAELGLPRQTEKKEPIRFFLYSLTRELPLKDTETLKQNGITSGEDLAFMIEVDNA